MAPPAPPPSAATVPPEGPSGGAVRGWELAAAVVAAAMLFQTLRAVFAGRLLQLVCQDHANFASFYQVAWNFQDSGAFRQTIHAGYTDTWVWGGHLTLGFPLASALLRLHPTPGFFQALQLAAVCSGVVAATLLGRFEARHPAGGLLGALAVVGSPPLLVLALCDFQDLVLCIPAVLWATLFIRRGQRLRALLACAAVAACREECVLLLPLLGLTAPRPRMQRLGWAAAMGLSGLAVLGVELFLARGLDRLPAPITQLGPVAIMALPDMLWQPGWLASNLTTYGLFFDPLGVLALLSPLHLVGVLGVLAVHLGDPFHAADWYSNVLHHFAPVTALLTAGVVVGGARLVRRLAGRGRWGAWVVWGGLAVAVVACGWRVAEWRVLRGAAWHSPVSGAPSSSIQEHPAWALARRIPAQAAVVSDTRSSLTIMSRALAYDFHGSLEPKTGGLGMRCVHFALVPEDDAEFEQAVRAVPGHAIVQSLGGYALYRVQPMDRPLPAGCTGEGR